MRRVDALIAANGGLKAVAEEEQAQLRGRAMQELRAAGEEAARLESSVEEGAASKRQLLAGAALVFSSLAAAAPLFCALHSSLSRAARHGDIASHATPHADTPSTPPQTHHYNNNKRAKTDLVETERQIALWERKIQLEREMQAALDPAAGAGALRAMRREVRRMELRLGELLRLRERLLQVR